MALITSTFTRDAASLALISTDTEGLKIYRTHKARVQKIESMADEINTIRSEFTEIKKLLQKITDRG